MSKLFKKKNEFSETIVILDIVIFLLYIIINIIMMWTKRITMPTDINAGVFAFLTGELGLLSFIKRSKLKTESVQDIIMNKIQPSFIEQTQNNNIDANSINGAAG